MLSFYAQLLTLAAKNKHKRSWAEAFFPKTAARSVRDDEVEVEDEPSDDASE